MNESFLLLVCNYFKKGHKCLTSLQRQKDHCTEPTRYCPPPSCCLQTTFPASGTAHRLHTRKEEEEVNESLKWREMFLSLSEVIVWLHKTFNWFSFKGCCHFLILVWSPVCCCLPFWQAWHFLASRDSIWACCLQVHLLWCTETRSDYVRLTFKN